MKGSAKIKKVESSLKKKVTKKKQTGKGKGKACPAKEEPDIYAERTLDEMNKMVSICGKKLKSLEKERLETINSPNLHKQSKILKLRPINEKLGVLKAKYERLAASRDTKISFVDKLDKASPEYRYFKNKE